jgi:hypothetical protein
MTTNELIEALKKEDPQGDAEVVVGGTPIYYVDRQPGYYDGSYSKLIIDESKKPFYCVKGIKHTRAGMKLKLVTMNMEDVLDNDANAIVELCPSLGEQRIAAYTETVTEMRAEAKRLEAEVKKWAEEREKAKLGKAQS